MALLPGNLLLISSHFMPPPRSSIINASSSGDHLDCFLAGGSVPSEDDECRFVPANDVDGGDVVLIIDCCCCCLAADDDAVIVGAAAGASIDGLLDEAADDCDEVGRWYVWVSGFSSSSSGLRSSAISTLLTGEEEMGSAGWCMTSMKLVVRV